MSERGDDPGALCEQLRRDGATVLRLTYADLHGIARGKDLPLELLDHAARDGVAFCVANLSDGLASNPTNAPGMAPGRGYPDMRVRPILSTLTRVPWEPQTAWCLGGIDEGTMGAELSPRGALARVEALFARRGLTPVVGPELEFFLLREDGRGGLARYVDRHSMVYVVGQRADPEGVLREMLQAAHGMGLKVTAANHEFCRSQYEINILHGAALDAADRTFRFKSMVKELAARHGLLATFMGRPFNDDAGSGFHIHLSLSDSRGDNLFAAADESDGLSDPARRFIAGIIAHAPALMAFFAPTVNSYKRLLPDSLVPTAANWAFDNRTSFVRVPAERGHATRLEIRAADAAANPYLAVAASLLAGLDGMERELPLPEPAVGDVSIGERVGASLPMSLHESLAALRCDDKLCAGLGQPLINAYCAMKEVEVARFRAYVTDWEINEYAWHL